ncbi:MAG: CYTH domain-containing protein [Deltaproteobacteria bacterium]|nr:CYTH domain-containing protein [Deltaproteobacteria bacterium]
MGTEIERKFLIQGEGWRAGAQGEVYRQGYLAADPDRTVRVRVVGERGTLTIKGRAEGLVRPEYEYPIPAEEASEMLDHLCLRPLIEKTRYRVPHGGRMWEVDEFTGENQGLIVAEIELRSADDPVEFPEWLGPEVSDDPRYYNANLVRRPFGRW